MSPNRAVTVIIPAHDEEGSIGACLDSVVAAADHAVAEAAVSDCRVVVVAHRCRDATAARSATVLAGRALAYEVLELSEPTVVGEVRNRGVARAADRWPPGEVDWVFSTDADSVVPVDWITGMLGTADRDGSALVLGLVELDDWSVDADVRAAYDRIVTAGLIGAGHTHAYAANLAVRWEAFDRVGGFGRDSHGEERGLERGVRAAGLTVSSVRTPMVSTSSRMPGRSELGLGALLRSLAVPEDREAPTDTQKGHTHAALELSSTPEAAPDLLRSRDFG